MQFPLFSIPLLFASCGYHFEGPGNANDVATLSIPYIAGDVNGQFTDEVIRQVALSGAYRYQAEDGRLELRVTLVDLHTEEIGWKYDREVDSDIIKDLIPTEARRYGAAEVTLVDAITDEVLYGPTTIEASIVYDFFEPDALQDLSFINTQGKRQTSVNFSLGQLDSSEGAFDSATTPLSRELAKKIVDRILRARY